MTTPAAPTPPDLNRRTVERIRAELGRHGITYRSLAVRLGKSETWVSRRLSPRVDYHLPLDLADIELIATALEIAPAELLAGSAA